MQASSVVLWEQALPKAFRHLTEPESTETQRGWRIELNGVKQKKMDKTMDDINGKILGILSIYGD